jgi:hypothetical protein
MDFETALERAMDGDALLFLGAGFSLGAVNGRGETFKPASSFAERLSAGHAVTTPDLQDASEAFLESKGMAALTKEVLLSLHATRTAKHHIPMAGLPWRQE